MTTALPIQAVTVLFQVDGHEPLAVDVILTDRDRPGLPQIAAGLVDLAARLIDRAEKDAA